MTRIDRILALDPDDVDSADVYFLMRIARAADDVRHDASTDDLFEILEELDEVDDEPLVASGEPVPRRIVEQHDLPDGRVATVEYYPEPTDPAELGVHRSHCCKIHGCKYNSEGDCPVVRGEVEQYKGYGWCQEPELVEDPDACKDIGIAAPGPDADADLEVEYDIEIIDQGFEPGTYAGWTVQFRALGAPRLSYQTQDPILDAYVPLERAPETAPRLGTGGGTALARTTDGPDIENAMMGHDGGVLRGFSGAALLEVMPVAIGNAPVAIPSDERIAEACQKALRVHLAAVRAERARLAVTETTESTVVGKRLKVKG